MKYMIIYPQDILKQFVILMFQWMRHWGTDSQFIMIYGNSTHGHRCVLPFIKHGIRMCHPISLVTN